MIKLMHINDYVVNTSQFQPLLHDKVVTEFENKIADFVGAKYACSLNSATSAIFLSLFEQKNITITIPSILPPVVANAILCSGNKISYRDDIDWVGNSYILHTFEDYKIIDSAQQLCKDQFVQQANDKDVMIFSFYPTKPVGSSDGGMAVSNDKSKIDRLRMLSRNGISLEENSWERKIILPGWKLYMNSIQAFIANENFKKLPGKMTRLREIREKYNSAFELNNTSEHLYRINVGAFDGLL
jgi:dTDP-4-amino-4,6-dideoxygalactose transaminase